MTKSINVKNTGLREVVVSDTKFAIVRSSMNILLVIVLAMLVLMPVAQANTYYKSFPFDLEGCKRHLKSIARAVKDAGGEVKKNDFSERSYQMTLDGTTTIYTCTRHELLETEL